MVLIAAALAAALLFAQPVPVSAQTSPLSAEARQRFHDEFSSPAQSFRIVANVYYVGARNIASYLITTPQGHFLIDTGTIQMAPLVLANIQKLGFRLQDVKILLSGHAHFDHVQGHAAVQRATGARAMAIGEDAAALSSGMDRSPLGDEGWEPVTIDRVLKDGETLTLGGTTLRAVFTPGHTPGCTTWTTTVQDKEPRPYSIVFHACGGGPNGGVKVNGNTLFPNLVQDTLRTYAALKMLKPDIYLPMHPEAYFKDKIDRMRAGERPHPLLVDAGAWTKMIEEAEANFQKRVQDEQKQTSAAR